MGRPLSYGAVGACFVVKTCRELLGGVDDGYIAIFISCGEEFCIMGGVGKAKDGGEAGGGEGVADDGAARGLAAIRPEIFYEWEFSYCRWEEGELRNLVALRKMRGF